MVDRDPVDDDEAAPAEPVIDDGEDLVAMADLAASRFADEAAAAAAAAAAEAASRRRPEPAITDVPRRRLRSEDDSGEPGALLQYPSAMFPAPPVFRIRVPEGWVAVPVPEAEMAVRRPEPIDGFIANVVVRVRRTAATAAVHDDVRAVVGLDHPPDGMEVLSDDVAADVTTPVRRVAMRFPGPDGEPLLARQLLVYVPATEHVANIVSVVATWPESAGPAVAAEMEAVVASLRLFTPRDRPDRVRLRRSDLRTGEPGAATGRGSPPHFDLGPDRQDG